MSRTVAIPDDLYARLEQEARSSGLPIEQLFQQWVQEGLQRLESKDREAEKSPVQTEEAGDEQVDSP
jgi:hypothetical protein